ncbi:uncharacterized protein LOC115412741 isoform X1 [Sphaeramia orbicularis]|uniref:Uncharacterized LOC115412741 n=1 Tax=Sphaeramia orbicularis TaxID=375764 RepID=A0A673AV75_9TELE|nr:uncharacterized protein LOC115412741 isoform X1 [Sphaeramia orbicularis]XP_029981253.1 uncharacterized protein LOC115412741 isoform X1 [Sphaeramia orbicularis]XP_029981262.1 uncharacterized protein LOC115412741 isoform X1 [Sphaeramia orbicularis]
MGRKRSVVWEYFKPTDVEGNTTLAVQCLLCGAELKGKKGTTSTMLRHLRIVHPDYFPNSLEKDTNEWDFSTFNSERQQEMNEDGQEFCSVEVVLEGEPTINEAEVDSAITRKPYNKMPVPHSASRPRSIIWNYFKRFKCLSIAQCHICLKKIKCPDGGSTSNLHRHISKSHPEVFSQLLAQRKNPALSNSSHPNSDTSTPLQTVGAADWREITVLSVEGDLEDGGTDPVPRVNEAEIVSAVNGIEAAQGASGENPPHEKVLRRTSRPQSLIWKYFRRQRDLAVAQCHICMKKIRCPEGGTTSNLHRHISTKHPEVSSELASLRDKSVPCNSLQVPVANGDTPSPPETDEAVEEEETAAINSNFPAAQGGSEEQTPDEEIRFAHVSSRARSLIWKYFRRLEGFKASQCQICLRKIKCPDKGTSNLHRHVSKKHPEVFSQLLAQKNKPALAYSSQVSHANGDVFPPPETNGAAEWRETSVSSAFDRETHVFRTEQDLIESLRRAQREELRALEQQREILHKLRAINEREAAAEMENIQSLRRTQEEEARDLNRQREELQREKEELQKKWEEFRQEREQALLITSEHQAPVFCD